MPDYDKSGNDTVVLTLPGTVIDENYSLLLLENSEIDLTTTVLLDKVQKGKTISDDAIKMLRKKGLIEGRKPHLYVSKQIAKVTNKQTLYNLCEIYATLGYGNLWFKKKCHFTLYYPHLFEPLQTTRQFEYVERTIKHRRMPGMIKG